MRLDKLEAGKVFRNYKVLCEELEMDIKNGKSKKYQLLELERHCNYSKKGHSYTIEDVYSKPQIKLRNSEGFIRIIKLLLLDLLAQENDNRIIRTRNQLLKQMNMTNSNYVHGRIMIPKLAQHINVNRAIVYDFYNTSDSNFKSTIERALKSLYDRRCIFYKKVIVVKKFQNFEHEVANDQEEQFIIACERRALDEMNCEKVSDIIASKRWDEFKKRVDHFLSEKKEYDIEYHYVAYDITLNQDGILGSYNSILDLLLKGVERDEQMSKLNETVISRFLHNARERREKAKEDNSVGFGTITNDYRNDDNYIIEIEKLLHILIKAGSDNILNDVKGVEVMADWSKGEISYEMAEMLESLS